MFRCQRVVGWIVLLHFVTKTIAGLALVWCAASISACSRSSPTTPSPSAIVTLRVAGGETFRVHLTSSEQVNAARRAQAGGPARIPNGRIATGTDVNTGWSWHLIDVEFVESTIELCDGRPSEVERAGVAFGGGRFCPWTATVITIDES